MDIPMSSAYLSGMLARVISIVAILAIAVVTTISAAHAARMGGMRVDHAVHPGEMMHASADAHLPCDGDRHCGSADAGTYEFVCTGLSVFLSKPDAEAGHAFGPAGHDLPSEASHVGRAPGLNERPPKIRLL
jgi:hypothetical protein